MPLKFKLIFTKTRTINWLLFLVLLAISLRIPLLTINRIAWKTDPKTNLSTPYLAAVNRASIIKASDILHRGFVINFSFITMVACVLVLTHNLYQASKIRRTFTAKGAPTSDQLSRGLSARDLQVVKSVVLVCSIFILAQVSYVVLSIVRLINPQFDDGSYLDSLFAIISQINNTFCYLNASVNIFVYYNYNSKFKSVFCSLLPSGHVSQ